MTTTGFYLVFVPGLTVATVAVAFTMAFFAMSQGPFQRTTLRGLASLIGAVVVLAVMFVVALKTDHLHLPAGV